MTLVLAWTDSTHAYMIADSAETHRLGPPEAEVSSLGQVQRQDERGPVVEERAQKVVEIGPGALVALLGNTRGARAFARHLFSLAEQHLADPQTNLQAAIEALREWDGGNDTFEAVIALSAPGEAPCLFGFSYPERTFHPIPPMGIIVRGSGQDAPLTQRLVPAIQNLRGLDNPSAEKFLVAMLAVMNGEALYTDLIKHSVGGCFIGAATGGGEVTWQPDILYMPYRPDFRAFGVESPTPSIPDKALPQRERVTNIITARVRRGHVAISSTYNQRAVVLTNGVLPRVELSKAFGRADHLQYEYAVLLPLMEGGRLVVIEGDDPALSPILFTLETTSIRSDLATLLTTHPTPEHPRTIFLDRAALERMK
ncbi:hypothetical protein [Hyalangium minutum]|uniref:hypothetical protein n=1 Tax=Hyalangium minutum TaxID=394096 RepID=UPI0012F959B5|nr:hypothetical protein [Hyalangium minutum]